MTRDVKYIFTAVAVKYAIGLSVGILLWYLSTLLTPTDRIASIIVLISSVMPTPLLSLVYSIERKLDPEIAGGMVTVTVVISSLILLFVGV